MPPVQVNDVSCHSGGRPVSVKAIAAGCQAGEVAARGAVRCRQHETGSAGDRRGKAEIAVAADRALDDGDRAWRHLRIRMTGGRQQSAKRERRKDNKIARANPAHDRAYHPRPNAAATLPRNSRPNVRSRATQPEPPEKSSAFPSQRCRIAPTTATEDFQRIISVRPRLSAIELNACQVPSGDKRRRRLQRPRLHRQACPISIRLTRSAALRPEFSRISINARRIQCAVGSE